MKAVVLSSLEKTLNWTFRLSFGCCFLTFVLLEKFGSRNPNDPNLTYIVELSGRPVFVNGPESALLWGSFAVAFFSGAWLLLLVFPKTLGKNNAE